MTIEEIEKEYCSKCIHNGYCYIPCPQVTSRQLEDALDYKGINRGKCMLCGKELTEGLFFCKECEEKGKGKEE